MFTCTNEREVTTRNVSFIGLYIKLKGSYSIMAKQGKIEARIIKAHKEIEKNSTPNQVSSNISSSGDSFIPHPTDLKGYKNLVSNSTILPQCIRAYKNNIAGFGIAVRYKEDIEETTEMIDEWNKISEVIEYLNMDQNTKEVFEDIIEARETYGIAYLEVIRNLTGEVIGIEFIRHTPTIQKTPPLNPFVEIEYTVKERIEKRPKCFCKYRQQHNGKTVYFKEIGDPRIMDKRNGEYGEGVPIQYQANEIIEFAIGTETYGEVRWIGQILGVDGSRNAESLNNSYFEEGRHTPLMIMVKNGTLTDESFEKLQGYMNGIKGESGQHAFVVLEAANLDSGTSMDPESRPEVELHNMASILQKDELFQEYLSNHRRKVQSAFQLPDIYVGYTTDFNRATALSAQEITEQQVFQPERQSLAWVINNKLLDGYNFKHVEVYFSGPEVSNVDDMAKILNIAERAGGLTPNKAKELAYKTLGGKAEDYPDDWGNVPLAARKPTNMRNVDMSLDEQINSQIQKTIIHSDDEITAVLKEIRVLLREREVV